MFKQFINTLQGDEVFMLISLMIFLLFFIGATLALIKMKKNHINYMSNIPLEDKTETYN
jgi:cbb3-type cytochrome oxidase subunit 3